MERSLWLAAASLAIGVAAIAYESVQREPSDAAPVVAVVVPNFPIPDAERERWVDRLRRVTSAPWAATDLLVVPFHAERELWLRPFTGQISPGGESNLLVEAGVSVLGGPAYRGSRADDLGMLAAAAARVSAQGESSGEVAAVVMLSCGTRPEGCADLLEPIVDLLEGTAALGGTGILVTVPLREFDRPGLVWAVGPHIEAGRRFRFRMFDLAPAILHLLALPLPIGIDGAPLFDMLQSEYVFDHPPRFSDG